MQDSLQLNDWISMKDEHPSKFRNILFTDGKEIHEGFADLYCHPALDNDEYGFYDRNEKKMYLGRDITHWKRKPKSPPEDKKLVT